jgi:hypothetical protein
MSMQQGDMTKVQKWGDVPPEGWYKVRVEKVQDREKDGSGPLLSKESNEPIVMLYLRAQNEPFVGTLIMDIPSLQPHALAKLKAYYEAVNYIPGPEGHDPEKLVGTELFIKVDHDVYEGNQRAKIAPYNIKSLNDGPKGALAQAKSA